MDMANVDVRVGDGSVDLLAAIYQISATIAAVLQLTARACEFSLSLWKTKLSNPNGECEKLWGEGLLEALRCGNWKA
jgi:hypothetical protein